MSLQNADRYSSTLASGYTAGGTSLSVTSASGLPGSGVFYLIVQAQSTNTEEVFLVTGVSGTTLTVTGAQANTTASNHSSSAIVIGTILTAGAITQLKADIVPTGGTTGQVLTKNSGTSYDTSWGTPSGGSPTGTAAGDLSGTYPNPGVATVGGATAANIASTVTEVAAATNVDTDSTLVKRDSSGNFSAGTITANLTGNASGTAASITGDLTGDVTSSGMVTTAVKINGVAVTGTPSSGQVPTATSGTAATWQTPSGGGSNYQTVEIGGTGETQRAKLNLIEGTGVTISAADNSGANSTDVTIAASGGGGGGYTPFANLTALANSGWTWANQGSSTINFSGGAATLSVPPTGAHDVRQYLQTLPTAPWTLIAGMVVSSGINPIGSTQNGGWLTGICITDGTKIITFEVNHYQSTPNPPQIDVIQWTNATTYDDTSYGGNPLQNVPPVLWLKIHDDATNRTYWTSQDPTNAGWVELATESDTAFLTPVSGGIFMDPYNTAQGSAAEFMSDLFVSFQLLDS